MRQDFYAVRSANYPRLKTDHFYSDYNNEYRYRDILDETFWFIEEFQLLDRDLWRRFVQQFREDADFDAGWRGEYWGKQMRGACFVFSYTKDARLYDILTQTVCDMLDSCDEQGRISSYHTDHEFDGWDIWCRKYVLLGMQYFLEICRDDALAQRIVRSMCAQVDYIMERIGDSREGKKPITSATRHWRGLNSSSLLEPIVRLYSITGDVKYFDFATYIVDCGGTDVANVFDLAYENEFYPYQYPVTKAYELISCFEGLLEYYRITGTQRYKTAIINFAERILDSEFTVIGSCGCSHELLDHGAVRQANTTNGPTQQETCVTVTLMKFMYQMTLLTGQAKYVDAFETSLYNAYLGTLNTQQVVEPTLKEQHPDWVIRPLPFDSYSPLTAGTRGNAIGGLKVMSDRNYYGCCACIGAAGIGLVPKMQLLTTEKGFALNLFINGCVTSGTPRGGAVRFETKTDYPRSGAISVTVHLQEEESFELLVRNPHWSRTTRACINGQPVPAVPGYISVERLWKDGDEVTVELDMTTRVIRPISYGTDILMNKVIWGKNYVVSTFDREDPKAKDHVALRRGPIMLAQDSRLGHPLEQPAGLRIDEEDCVSGEVIRVDTYPNMIALRLPKTDGSTLTVTDYASAGKLWTQESRMAVWMLNE